MWVLSSSLNFIVDDKKVVYRNELKRYSEFAKEEVDKIFLNAPGNFLSGFSKLLKFSEEYYHFDFTPLFDINVDAENFSKISVPFKIVASMSEFEKFHLKTITGEKFFQAKTKFSLLTFLRIMRIYKMLLEQEISIPHENIFDKERIKYLYDMLMAGNPILSFDINGNKRELSMIDFLTRYQDKKFLISQDYIFNTDYNSLLSAPEIYYDMSVKLEDKTYTFNNIDAKKRKEITSEILTSIEEVLEKNCKKLVK